MAVDFDDGPLFDHTSDISPVTLPEGVGAARRSVMAAARALLAIPDSSMDEPWQWERGEVELRYAFYRSYELFEAAEVAARSLAGPPGSRAAALVGPATAARWDLVGLLLPLGDELDADPGGGEWTIRRTMGHVINGQRAYGWGTAWWQAQRLDPGSLPSPARLPEALIQTLPDEETDECAGTLTEILERFGGVFDRSTERLAGLPDDRLALGAGWSGLPVDIAFRLGRWSSHVREHTIQVEKTLAMIGRPPSEAERMVRVVLAAYGRAEAVVFGRPRAETAEAVEEIAGAAEAARVTAEAARASS